MSRIYFHSPSGEACVSGSERAYMGCLVDDLAFGALKSSSPTLEDWIVPLLPKSCYARHAVEEMAKPPGWVDRFHHSLRLWLAQGYGEFLTLPDGKQLSPWQCALNTVLAIGSDPLKLFARLHGQCEIHCHVRGEHRGWLGRIISRGIRDGLYRDTPYRGDRGQWSEVADFIRSDDSESVVCSYSVCESFPNPSVAGWDSGDDDDGEKWSELGDAEKWRLGMAGLESRGGLLELSPDDWADYRFGSKVDYLRLHRLAADTSEGGPG